MATTSIAVKLFLALLNFAGMSPSPRVARQPVIFSRAPRYVPNPAQPRTIPARRPNASFSCTRCPAKTGLSHTTPNIIQLNPCSAGVAVVVGYSVHMRARLCIPQHNICLMVERQCELSHASSCYEGCNFWQNELIGRNVEDLHLPGSL